MKPLVSLDPLCHPLLGTESFTSYLRRLADLYGISLNQMLRYLSESKEVSDLVGEAPFRLSKCAPSTLSGYARSVFTLTRRVTAANGNHAIGGTTLQRIAPSLTPIATGSIVSKRQFCKRCFAQIIKRDEQPLWEPLIWSLATVTCCPLHGCRLDIARNPWKSFDPRDQSASVDRIEINGEEWRERWQIAETRKLIEYCSGDPGKLTMNRAPETFISEFVKLNGMSALEFANKIGFGYTSVSLKISLIQKTSLRSVFCMAQRLAISPVDILDDPISAARQGSLFGIPSANDLKYSCTGAARRQLHPSCIYGQLRSDLRSLLASPDPVPSLASVCRARGVSTGYARHRMPIDTIEYQARHAKDQKWLREKCQEEARRVAREALLECGEYIRDVSLKKMEQNLRAKTGLPKHVLADALRNTLLGLNMERSQGVSK